MLQRSTWPALGVAALVGALTACSDPGGGVTSSSSSSPSTTNAEDTSLAPPHHWITKEGQVYGYAVAISDDDRKAGRAVSDVLMFRYLGERGGLHVVATDNDNGLSQAICPNPCAVIHLVGPGRDDHITFNPDSVIGEVLTDAMNGQLEVYGSGQSTAPTVEQTPPSPPSQPTQSAPTQAQPAAPAPVTAKSTPIDLVTQPSAATTPAVDARSTLGFRDGWNRMAWCVINTTPTLMHQSELSADAIKARVRETCAGAMVAANYLTASEATTDVGRMVDRRMTEVIASGAR